MYSIATDNYILNTYFLIKPLFNNQITFFSSHFNFLQKADYSNTYFLNLALTTQIIVSQLNLTEACFLTYIWPLNILPFVAVRFVDRK